MELYRPVEPQITGNQVSVTWLISASPVNEVGEAVMSIDTMDPAITYEVKGRRHQNEARRLGRLELLQPFQWSGCAG